MVDPERGLVSGAKLRTLLDRAPLNDTDPRAGMLQQGTRAFEELRAENQVMRDRLERAANEHSRNVRSRLAPGIMGP